MSINYRGKWGEVELLEEFWKKEEGVVEKEGEEEKEEMEEKEEAEGTVEEVKEEGAQASCSLLSSSLLFL